MMTDCRWASLLLLTVYPVTAWAQVERIWLTHRSNDPSKLVVNWTTKMSGDSKVRYGPTRDYGPDRGTTWQTCHDFVKGSTQYEWYRTLMASGPPGFVVTLHNERNATMRGQEKGAWHQLFRQGDLVISGFGYYAERAEADGLTYLNTSLGKGTKYADPKAKFIVSEASYVLLTFERGKASMTVELKSFDGKVLDRTTISMRKDRE